MSTAATLVLKVVTDTKQAAAGMDNVAKSTSSFKDKIGQASKVASVALLGIGVAAIKAGKAAAEDQQSQVLLANAMQKNAGASKEAIAATEDWITKQSLATGVADDQLRPALGNLVRATGDVAKSQDALQVAMDVSAATGKDLGSVSKAMAKGFGGSTTALGKLVPGISKAALESGDMTKVMGELADKTGGAMAAKAGTATGQMDRMTVAMNEAEESMGAALLPLMGTFAGVAAKVAKAIGDNTKAFQIIIVVIGSFAAAIVTLNYAMKAYNVVATISAALTKRDTTGKLTNKAVTLAIAAATKTWTAAQWLFNAAVSANPIGLVIVAAGLLAVAFVLLYKRSKTFREFVDRMWTGIKNGAQAAARVFKQVWQAVFSVVRGYIQAWVAYFRLVFNTIKGLVKLVVAVFKGDWRGAMDAIRGILQGFRDFFRALFNALPDPVQRLAEKIRTMLGNAITWIREKFGALGDVMSKPFDAAKDAIGWLVDKINDLISALGRIKFPSPPGWLDKIPGFGGFSAMAASTSTPSPMMAARGVSGFGAPTVAGVGVGARAAMTGGLHIEVNGALDPEAVARQINRILYGHDRRVGLAS